MRCQTLFGVGVVLLTLAAGCRHSSRRACDPCAGGGPAVGLQEPLPIQGGRIPPTSVPATPGESRFRVDPYAPQGERLQPVTPADVPAPSPPSNGRPAVPVLPPADVPLTGETARTPANDPLLAAPAAPPRSSQAMPRVEGTAPVPAGLPGYTTVPGRTNLAQGRKPAPEGFDALKQSGVKVVLYLHAPDADTGAARELAAARGLAFEPLPVSPETLGEALEPFARAVQDAPGRPLFIVDDSQVRAGSLWYLLFRTKDLQSDEVARVRARPLGLPDAATEEGKRYWLAIQRIVGS